MNDVADRASVLMDGPAARTPERVAPGMSLRGRRVIALTMETAGGVPVGAREHRDLRAVDDPYYRTEDHVMWPSTQDPPDGYDGAEATLYVAVCAERDWYLWAHTRIRPRVNEWPAYLVWVE